MIKAVVQGPDVHENPDATEVQTVAPLAGLTIQEFEELAASIMVIIPHRSGEGICGGIADHFGMWGRMCLRVARVKDPHGGFVEHTRGGMVDMFLKAAWSNPNLKYCVMIDNDEAINWDAPLRLAQHGLPVVSGVVCGWNPERGLFACFQAKDDNGIARFPSHRETKFLPAEGVIEVEAMGAGLLCIRRDVLETLRENDEQPFMLPEEGRAEDIQNGNLTRSEDICFCHRAKKYGFKRYVDLAVHAVHYKTLPLSWPADSVDPNISAIDWKPSTFDYKGV